jgi:hypothetical protein
MQAFGDSQAAPDEVSDGFAQRSSGRSIVVRTPHRSIVVS